MLKRKFLMKVLAATVAATMAVTPSTAFAEGGEEVFADEGDVTEEFGDITADGEGEDALTVYAWDGNEADVTTGSLTSEDHIGADVWADGDSVTWVSVNGDIDSADKGVDSLATDNGFAAVVVDGNINSGSDGVHARAGKKGADTDESGSLVQVAGDVEAEESGIWVEACGAGKVEVDVGGNVIGGNEYGTIYVDAKGGGTQTTAIRAGGDVRGNEIGATL